MARPAPQDAHPSWRQMSDILKRLLEIHINHESMRENAQQTVFEPPFNEDLVYVMWQYLDRLIVSDAIPLCPTRRNILPPLCSCTSALSPLPLAPRLRRHATAVGPNARLPTETLGQPLVDPGFRAVVEGDGRQGVAGRAMVISRREPRPRGEDHEVRHVSTLRRGRP